MTAISFLLRDSPLSRCTFCLCLFANTSTHDCKYVSDHKCMITSCGWSFDRMKELTNHMNTKHPAENPPADALRAAGLRRCADCRSYLSLNTNRKSHKCRTKKSSGPTSGASSGGRTPARARLTPAAATPAPPAPPRTWTFGKPDSDSFSWLFVPLIRCALGLDNNGGQVERAAGPSLWAELRDSYAAEFLRSGVSAASLPFDGDYLPADAQVSLLLGPLAGGKSNISDEVEGKLTAFATRMQRLSRLSTSSPTPAQDSKASLSRPFAGASSQTIDTPPAPVPATPTTRLTPPSPGAGQAPSSGDDDGPSRLSIHD